MKREVIADRLPVPMRKPCAGPLLDVNEVIAHSLNYSLSFDWQKRGHVDENSVPVKAIREGLRYAGYEIVPIGREQNATDET